MFHVKYFFCLISIDLIVARPQLNLYYTNEVSENANILQHTCLQHASSHHEEQNDHQVISYCMSELSSKFKVEKNSTFPNFNFGELRKRNITSRDLYLWSAPIDIIENYQFYLNQPSNENNSSLSEEIYHNCTILRFGPLCQYQLFYSYSHDSSLDEIITDYYFFEDIPPDTLTCYIHLKCNHSLPSMCLGWENICNGEIDCFDSGLDEEHCWQLEINQCEENEYQCENGQCIPKSFYGDSNGFLDCLDSSDSFYVIVEDFCSKQQSPSFECDDVPCSLKPTAWPCQTRLNINQIKAMYSKKESFFSSECWSAVKCVIKFTKEVNESCPEICEHDECIKNVEDNCPDMLYLPNVPVLFGNVYLGYKTNGFRNWTDKSNAPVYICYKTSQYDDYFVDVPKIFFDNMTCVDAKPFVSFYHLTLNVVADIHFQFVDRLHVKLKRYHLSFNYTSTICNRSNMYQCNSSSKCIPMNRLMDRVYNCPHMDDEDMEEISKNHMEYLKKNFYKCTLSGKYIHSSLVGDGIGDCEKNDGRSSDEEIPSLTYRRTHILFQHICDGLPELLPILIEDRNETDETECEQWPCNNIYGHCYNGWNCPIGADKISCASHRVLNCSSKHQLCVSPSTNEFMCLPMKKINDGNADCLGGTDEPTLCGQFQRINFLTDRYIYLLGFYCMNQSFQSCPSVKLCNGINECDHGDDEQFCRINDPHPKYSIIYGRNKPDVVSEVRQFLHVSTVGLLHVNTKYFILVGMTDSDENLMKTNVLNPSSPAIEIFGQHLRRCHRGIDVLVWLTNNLTQRTCLCPPSFYGDRCQYQNERVSLSMKFRALASSLRIPFAIIISLIDDSDRRIIHSYEQFTYLSMRDCQMKFHSYLLYSTKPKDLNKTYSIHIDVYEKFSLNYRGSLLFPVKFPFLPVQRIAFIANIPRSNDKNKLCTDHKCIHGKCIKYSNNPSDIHFCQCDPGWSGRYCTIKHHCTCASDSLCLGISADNRSICVCSMNKFGSRCLLTDPMCERNDSSTCQNGGRCISNIDSKLSSEDFFCICPKGFNGTRCEIPDNKLILSFGKDITVSRDIFIHFIDIFSMRIPQKFVGRGTTFRKIPFQQNSVIVYWPDRFHLAFTELFNKIYYLTVVQNVYKQSTTIIRTINSSDRCPPISELFNETFVKLHLLRRIKYYHLPCQNRSLNLSCFHDEIHFCLCYEYEEQRLSNCFQFDHNNSYDCSGQNECENGGRCLQNRIECPTTSICQCLECSYGSRCQFRTDGFGLSLDGIIGYHIFPNASLNQQPIITKISLSLTVIFVILGILNGIICIITFQNKNLREVGCGLYLLSSSITTLFLMIIFGLKFMILLFAQMGILSNRLFLEVQCHSVDFLLRVCLSLDQWANACVAVERGVATMKGANFDKKKSKQAAKYIILILSIVVIATSIHDPIYRHLIDEENEGDDEKRTWCIVTYPFSLEIYNSLMNIFHLCGPFILNLVSSIILITKKSRQQSTIHPDRNYKEILRQQFREHKHLLTAPIVIVILAVGRLILAAVSKCMKSADEPWLFFVAYFIPFIAPMLTFIIFVVPSKFYMKEFRKTLLQYRTTIQQHFHWTS